MSREGTLKVTVKAARIMGLIPALHMIADELELGLTILWHDRGWWFDTARVEFMGHEEELLIAKRQIERWADGQ